VLEILLFARQAVREDINVAKATFAMTPPVAARIAPLTLQQVRTIAFSNTQQLGLARAPIQLFWGEIPPYAQEYVRLAWRRQLELKRHASPRTRDR
jgi:hypothetical protein